MKKDIESVQLTENIRVNLFDSVEYLKPIDLKVEFGDITTTISLSKKEGMALTKILTKYLEEN